MEEECIQECSDIILWFGKGSYVEKAKMLREYFSGETSKEKMIEELKRRAQLAKQSKEFQDDSEDIADLSNSSEENNKDSEKEK